MHYRHTILASALLSLVGLTFLAHSLASLAGERRNTVEMESPLISEAAAADGKLTSAHIQGEDIHTRSTAAESRDGINAGYGEHGSQSSHKGETLVPETPKKSTVQVTSAQPVQVDDLSVSPFKGPDDAQVVMAVFSDFQ